ncbi:DsbA family protein, partial [Microbacterium testaceum]|uniref:DsbA family protein n=1 Tax=Microbacterium testaceum TaxID=2033 RepID=UPI002AC7DCCA
MRLVNPRAAASITRLLSAAAICALVGGSIAGCGQVATTLGKGGPPSEQQETAFPDDGYLKIGSGPRTVDLYLDAMCPYCKVFEQTSGPLLWADAEKGETTVRLHPLAILDRLSQGTEYSTRAAAYLTAVAEAEPDKLRGFVQALYAHQPAENSSGLSNQQLDALASASGISADLTPASYVGWVRAQTALALQGPLPTTDQVSAIQHVPTVIVQGDVFAGDSSASDLFESFYLA